MTTKAKHSAINTAPIGTDMPFGLTQILSQLTENSELMSGQLGNGDSRSVFRGDFGDISTMPNQQLISLTAKGAGVSISGTDVPTLADYQNLIRDVNLMTADMLETRNQINTLLNIMKGLQ